MYWLIAQEHLRHSDLPGTGGEAVLPGPTDDSAFLNANQSSKRQSFRNVEPLPRRIFDLLELAESEGVPALAAFAGPLSGELRNQRD
jgi:hypothetical protein